MLGETEHNGTITTFAASSKPLGLCFYGWRQESVALFNSTDHCTNS